MARKAKTVVRKPDTATISVEKVIKEAEAALTKKKAAQKVIEANRGILTGLRDAGHLGTAQASRVTKVYPKRGRRSKNTSAGK